MTMKKSRPMTMVITMVMTITARCVLRVKTSTPRKTQPNEIHSVIKVLSKITFQERRLETSSFKLL